MENSPQRLTMQGVMEVEDKAEAAVVTELLDMVKSPFLKVVISSDTLWRRYMDWTFPLWRVQKMEAPLTYVQYVKGASIGQGGCSVRHKEYFILSVLVWKGIEGMKDTPPSCFYYIVLFADHL